MSHHPTPMEGDPTKSESLSPLEPEVAADSTRAEVEEVEEIEPKLAHAHPRIEESIRETFEAIVTAFLLAFVFRAFVVEAFVIPTGSMAPTLLGEHHRLGCAMCGYTFTVGVERDTRHRFPYTPCPMCDHRIPLRLEDGAEAEAGPETAVQSGDRILVLKYLYEFLGPRRWDVVVFKNPSKVDEFDENYIKRLIGLPGEQVWLVDGNVYARRAMNGGGPESGHPEEGAPWEIQRKPVHVQRVVWRPVYHSDYYPLDAEQRGWKSPWLAEGSGWEFDPIGPRWRWAGGSGGGNGENAAGELVYDFSETRHQMRWPYNRLLSSEYDEEGPITIDEAAVSATVTPGSERCSVELWASDRKRVIRAVVEPDGAARIEWRGRDEGPEGRWREAAAGRTDPLTAGRPRRMEFWSVDKALWLWVDGERVAYEEEFAADLHEIAAERLEKPHPQVKLVVHGAATVRSVDLDRDLYYTQAGRGVFLPARVPDDSAALGSVNRPATVGPDEFFVLGDNSPWSGDSRRWTTVNPWIEQLTGVEVGFVPREMMLGKAFFVYFPARYTARGVEANIVPNFGDMRFIR